MTNKHQRLLYLVLALQGLTVAGQWLGQPTLPAAQAQVPDAGAQRIQIMEELRAVNSNLNRLVSLLESGNVQVKTAPVEQPKGR